MKRNQNIIRGMLLIVATLLAPGAASATEPAATVPSTNLLSLEVPAALATNIATNPVPRPSRTNWSSDHDSYVAAAKRGGIDLLFLGDSITAGWSKRGPGGLGEILRPAPRRQLRHRRRQNQQVLWRIENGELDGIKPKVVVLLDRHQ